MHKSTDILTTKDVEQVGDAGGDAKKPKVQQILIGWDKQRSYTLIGLMICLVAWACIFFPLLDSNNI